MTDKYQNKYRVKSARLQNWNYGWNAQYFITICTAQKNCCLGNIVEGIMELTEIGDMAQKYWFEIPIHFPFVKLHEFIVMPNHIHGIIEIAKLNDGHDCNDDNRSVETQNIASLRKLTPSKNKFGPQSNNLASIIRGYKIGVTKNATKVDKNWAWQSRFYEHIIRNKKSYKKISEYIINNPIRWNEDRFNNELKEER